MSLHTSGGPKVCVQLCTGAYRCVQVRTGAYRCVQVRTVAYSCVQLRTGCTQLYATVRSSQRFTKRAEGAPAALVLTVAWSRRRGLCSTATRPEARSTVTGAAVA